MGTTTVGNPGTVYISATNVKEFERNSVMFAALKVKNNKLNYDAILKQVDMMFPPDLKAPVKAAAEKCKDICEYSRNCLTAQPNKRSAEIDRYQFNPSVFDFANFVLFFSVLSYYLGFFKQKKIR